jgi:CheY-like chemotaxis protein
MFIDIDSCHPHPPHLWDVPLRQPIILYVERNSVLRHFMSDMFDLAGWHVHRAFDLHCAASLLRSTQRFSLLLTGHELPPRELLPGRSGLELVTLARELPHRTELPILFFSIEDCEREAKKAGANAFLRKPHDLFLMVDTIRGLLEAK